jgi:serine/threonine protein kinase
LCFFGGQIGANILVGNDGTIKLADFGASKRFFTSSVASNTAGHGVKGTPLWMAPEVIREQQTAHGWKKADVWSVGCTIIEMATGKQIYLFKVNHFTSQ